MKLVYFGRKRPKVIKTVAPELLEVVKEEDKRKAGGVTFIASAKNSTYKFVPFQTIEVEDEVAKVLLDKAGDIFKCVDSGDSAPDPNPVVKTDGYVGDIPAEKIKDLKKVQDRQTRVEEGKSIEEIIDTEKSKKKRVKEEK
uniref:Uncharacterized protein n=1 Tax=viral metagenome TaxID=1070528 RepID=A0A6H1ZA96_9ZZZZ